jgi:phytoene desaturase
MTRHDPAREILAARDGRPVAIVIGAGFGGLAAAIRLGVRGYRAIVLDRLDAPGGRGTALVRDGFRFDLGPTIVTVPQVFEALWSLAGRRMADDVDLRPLDPFYTILWPDGSSFAACADTAGMRAEIARLCPRDVAGYDRFLEASEARYRIAYADLGRRPMHRLWEMLRVLPHFARLRADRSTFGEAAAHFGDERLRMAMSFHPLFIGGDPFHVTSMYTLVAHLEKAFGVHCVIGGTAALAAAMARLGEATGGEILHGVTVDAITVRDGRATGVRLDTGEALGADIVVSNADAGHTYHHLLRGVAKARWTDRRLRRARWSAGLFVWHFGTRGTRGLWPGIGHHTILNGPRYRGLCDDIFIRGRLAEDMSLYLHRPCVTDPSAAPEGCDSFYCLAPVPHLGHPWPVNWAAETPRFLSRMAAMLERRALPGLRERIVVEAVMTPADFATRYLAPFGTGFSLEPRILQSAWFRPHNRSEEVRGLYLVGAGTHPGAGLPGVVSSAEIVDQLVPDPVPAEI